MEVVPDTLAFKQEIKEEDEVCFELISVKEEIVFNETEQLENCLDVVSQNCFVVDGIKEENEIKQDHLDDTELNKNIEFKEEINCVWFEPPSNEPDPLAISDLEFVVYKRKTVEIENETQTEQNAKLSRSRELSKLRSQKYKAKKKLEKNPDDLRAKEMSKLWSQRYRNKKKMEKKDELNSQTKKLRSQELRRLRNQRYINKKKVKS